MTIRKIVSTAICRSRAETSQNRKRKPDMATTHQPPWLYVSRFRVHSASGAAIYDANAQPTLIGGDRAPLA